jgi:hypothetical protein
MNARDGSSARAVDRAISFDNVPVLQNFGAIEPPASPNISVRSRATSQRKCFKSFLRNFLLWRAEALYSDSNVRFQVEASILLFSHAGNMRHELETSRESSECCDRHVAHEMQKR